MEDLIDGESIFPVISSAYDQLSFDTSFYNPYIPNRRKKEGKVDDMNVCFGTDCYSQSNVNYFAMGMYYASSGTSKKDMYLTIYLYKKYFNNSLPSPDTLCWADQGYDKYFEYKKKDVEFMKSVTESLTTTIREEYDKYENQM